MQKFKRKENAMNTIELLKDAIEKKAVSVDDGAMFALLDNTLCDVCCGDRGGGNGTCKPTQ
jgi:hypothetical protein